MNPERPERLREEARPGPGSRFFMGSPPPASIVQDPRDMTPARNQTASATWRRAGARAALIAAMVAGLGACGPRPENNPVYLALKANPPKEIPARHLPKLRKNRPSCEVFNQGQPGAYMTCWLPVALGVPPVASLSYYGPGTILLDPTMLVEAGGNSITGDLPIR